MTSQQILGFAAINYVPYVGYVVNFFLNWIFRRIGYLLKRITGFLAFIFYFGSMEIQYQIQTK